MYKYVNCIQPTYFDVDDTLVMWFVPLTEDAVIINDSPVMPNQPNIDALKRHAMRGHTIIVWSKGGSAWARDVVDALGLKDLVDVILEKPQWYYDDQAAAAFMGNPHYYSYETGESTNGTT